MLQCDVCQQQVSAETASQPEASLVKASEAAEMLHPVYVYCEDCNQYLCKPCDYKAHHDSNIALSAGSDEDELKKSDALSQECTISATKKADYQSNAKDTLSQGSTTKSQQQQKRDDISTLQRGDQCLSQQKKKTRNTKNCEDRDSTIEDHLDQLSQKMALNHNRIQICEECAEQKSEFFCPKCEQALCQACWKKIHNKGARRRHQQKSLQKVPKFFQQSSSISVQQPSASNSSMYQDSIGLINQEKHDFDPQIDSIDFEEREKEETLSFLQVHLHNCLGPQGNSYDQQNDNRQSDIKNRQQANFNMGASGIKYKQSRPHGHVYPDYGQSPSYMYQHQHGAQIQMNGAQFMPSMNYQNFHHPQQHYGFVPSQHNGHFYMYPDEHQGGPIISFDGYGHQMHHPGSQQQVNWNFPMGQSSFQPSNRGNDQFKRGFPQTGNFSQNKQSQQSEDEVSTGIYEEAKFSLPSSLLELDPPRTHAQSVHENTSSLFQNKTGGSDESDPLKEGFNPITNPKFTHTLSHGESSLRSNQQNQSAYCNLQSNSKSFTPLRRGQQSSNELFKSPHMETPTDQLRVEQVTESKFLSPSNNTGKVHGTVTPPVQIGDNSAAKTKFGQSAMQGKTARPSRQSRGVPNVNTQNSTQPTNSGSKNSMAADKRGSNIQHYQVKSGKSNSMSQHDMNSDHAAEGYSYSKQQIHKNFDAYQAISTFPISPPTEDQSSRQVPMAHSTAQMTSLHSFNIPFMSTKSQTASDSAYGQQQRQHLQLQNNPLSQSAHQNNRKNQNLNRHKANSQSQDYSAIQEQKTAGASKAYNNQLIFSGNNSCNGAVNSNQKDYQYKVSASGANNAHPYYNTTTNNNIRYESYGSVSKKSASTQSYTSGNVRGNALSELRGAASRPVNNETVPTYQPRRDTSNQLHVPIFQPAIQIEPDKRSSHGRKVGTVQEESKHGIYNKRHHFEENNLMCTIQHILFENAALGELLILKTSFVEQIVARTPLDQSKALKAVERAVSYGIIHQTDRNFANSKKIEFISLKVQVMSHQCLQWVITSLRRDEMTPTETAIKNRTKEAFNFKLQNDYWDAVMKSIQLTPALSQQQHHQDKRVQRVLSDSSQHSQTNNLAQNMPPDKGSSALTHVKKAKNHHHKHSGDADSSQSHSSVNSAPQKTLTTSTISAQGITRITLHKQSIMTEADSGSTNRKKVASRDTSMLGAANKQSTQAATADLHGMDRQLQNNSSSTMTNQDPQISVPQNTNQSSNLLYQPRFKVVKQKQLTSSEVDSSCKGGLSTNGTGAVYAIYMEDEEVWTGVDIDDDSSVDLQLYSVMISFLREYFCPSDKQGLEPPLEKPEHQAILSDDLQNGELRMIPGGRYGCTQFLKICGPEAIRKCSVGKTTQMVQLAIKEDILRHLKTQIVWSTQVDKHKVQQDSIEDQQILVQRKAKLEKVKEAIIEILAESKTGMSLAQLPQYLKKKLPFNLEWNELGFPKLKDLLNSMEDNIKVELRDANHPFAYLVHKKRRDNHSQHQSKQCLDKPIFRGQNLSEQIEDCSTRQMVYDDEKLSQVIQAVFSLLRIDPSGIREKDLGKRIQSLLNFDFSYRALGCNSEFEFVKNYIMPKDDSIEFIHIPENGKKTFILRSKKIYTSFFGPMVKQNGLLMMEPQNQQAQPAHNQPNQGYYSSSQNQNNFYRGGQPDFQKSKNESSDASSDFQALEHRKRIESQNNPCLKQSVHKLSQDQILVQGFSGGNGLQIQQQQPDFPTYDSIHGVDDSVSESCSSQQNLMQAIGYLTDDYDSQGSITPIPIAQPSHGKQNHMRHQQARSPNEPRRQDHQLRHHSMMPSQGQQLVQFQPWYPPSHPNFQNAGHQNQPMPMVSNGAQFDGQLAFNSGMFDNLKIDHNFQGSSGMNQMFHGGRDRGMMNFFAMPIDKSDELEDGEKRVHLSQQRADCYRIFQQYEYDNDSPRQVQQHMKGLFDYSSPAKKTNEYEQQNCTAYDIKSQYDHFSGNILDQSIFSEPIEKARGSLSAVYPDTRNKSIDMKLNSRPEHAVSEKETYCPLLPPKNFDENVSLRSWQPKKSSLSNQLEVRLAKQMTQIVQEAQASLSGDEEGNFANDQFQ